MIILGILIASILVFLALSMFSSPSFIPQRNEMTITVDAEGKRDLLSFDSPVVLKVDIHGVVGLKDLTTQKIQNILLDSREDPFKNNRIKAIFLHIDSPGGTVTDADGIYRALADYKKKYNVPIYAFVDGLCASGGMYIASSAEKIYATPTSVIGSVGVILGPAFNFSGVMDKVGVQALTITQGLDKDMLSPWRPWKPDEDASLKAITASLYDIFIDVVTAARPKLSKEDLVNQYGAQVYVSSKAKELGYIDDDNSDYNRALADLAATAGIEKGQGYQVVQLQPSHGWLSQLTDPDSRLLQGTLKHQVQMGPIDSELSGKFLYLFQAQPQ